MSTSCLHVFLHHEFILSQRQESLLINARLSSCAKTCPLHSDVSAFQLIPINAPVCLEYFFSFMLHFFLPSPCSRWLFHFPDSFSFKTSFLVRLAFLKLLILFSRCLTCCPKQNQNREHLCLIKDLFTLSILSHELLSRSWPGLFSIVPGLFLWIHFNQPFVSTNPWKLFFLASSTTSTVPHPEIISISYFLRLSGEGPVTPSAGHFTWSPEGRVPVSLLLHICSS